MKFGVYSKAKSDAISCKQGKEKVFTEGDKKVSGGLQ